MTEVPKIVHQRLRAAEAGRQTGEGAHPEADVLAGFAEQALSAAERQDVLEHLAVCGDCREVVMLALPVTESLAAPVEYEAKVGQAPVPVAARWGRFAWGNLRWAALAAGVAVAILVARPGLERWVKPNAPPTTAASQTAAPKVAPAPTAQLVSGSAMTHGGQVETRGAAAKQESLASKRKAGPFGASPRELESGTPIAGNMKQGSAADKSSPVPPSAALAFEAPESTTESVEVSGAAAGIQTPSSSRESSLMTRNETPAIEKAKPALHELAVAGEKRAVAAEAQAQASVQGNNAMFGVRADVVRTMSLKPNVMWVIRAGVLERSLDGGQNWQTAVKADRVLLCYATRGQEVWAGGQAGTLMHSTDGGATWSAVKVSLKDQPLTSDVARIELPQGTTEVVLPTTAQGTWISDDGGKTWATK